MTEEKDLYQQLLDDGYSKRDIHKVLHTLMMEIIKNKQLTPFREDASAMVKTNPFERFKKMVAQRIFRQ